MKKIISFTLALITTLLALVSCTPTQGTTPNATTIQTSTNDNSQKFIIARNDNKYFYKSFVYYKTEPSNIHESTIKYKNLDNQDEGLNLYNNAFGGEDPFKAVADAFIMLDEEATQENRGIPVLIIAMNTYKYDTVGTDFKIVKFDTATNMIKVLAEDKSGEKINNAFIYENTLYFQKWTRHENDEVTYNFYKMNKNGGEITCLPAKITTQTEILDIYNQTIYFSDLISRTIYKSDLNFENCEKIMSYKYFTFTPYIDNGYLYYSDKIIDMTIDKKTIKVANVYRKKLDNFEESSPELLLENVTKAVGNKSNIAFYFGNETEIYEMDDILYSYDPLLKLYDTKTNEIKIISDKRGERGNTKHTKMMGCYDNYIWYTSIEGVSYFINIQTGYKSYITQLEE